MKYSSFKEHLKEYCKAFSEEFPQMKDRHKLYKAYDMSLKTAPVPDNIYTLEGFLINADWSEIFEPEKQIKLAPLPTAVPCRMSVQGIDRYVPQQEGTTPMRYNDNYASASASVTAPQSDAAIQRDYLLDRLSQIERNQSFAKLFNLHVDNTPKTYKELIDAIKNDKFKLDDKAVKKLDNYFAEDSDYPTGYNPYGPWFGIIWDGPQPDSKGYQAAMKEARKQATATKDIIMTGDAAAGLKALQAFEAWSPSVTASSDTAH